jgi:HPt (histidine-containing phosphotransfer) domain-containing protein
VNASPFCTAAVCEAAGGDAALARELLDIFVRTVPPMVLRLGQALACGHPAQVAHEAHDLKSCLALVGAASASATCARIETASRRAGTCPPPAEGARLCADIGHIVDQARRHLGAGIQLEEATR